MHNNRQGASLAAQIADSKVIALQAAVGTSRAAVVINSFSATATDSDDKHRLANAVFQIGLNLE